MVNYFDDEYMIYDINQHKYFLTFDGYEALTGEALSADHGLDYQQGDRMLKRVTQIVYNYIYTWARDKDRTEYEASLPKYRDTIRDALAEMMTGLLANKTDMTMFFNNKNYRFSDTVTPGVKTILRNGGILTRAKLYKVEDYEKGRGEVY